MSQPPGRSRGLATGRGAQLLAALEASRRPGQPLVQVPPPANPTIPGANTSSAGVAQALVIEATPTPKPICRSSALLLAKRQATGPQVQAMEPAVGESCTTPPIGRGTFALLRATQQSQILKQMTSGRESVEEVTSSVTQLTFTESYPRPILEHQEKPPVVKKGEKGAKVDIVANYIRLTVDPQKGIYEYEVRFEPAIDSRDMRFKLLGQHKELLGPAKTFDGTMLYLPFKLTEDVAFLRSQHVVTNEPITLKVILKQKRRFSECVQFYNVLFRKIARILGMVQMNRNYFNPHTPIAMPAEYKLEVWPGYVTAIREFEDGLMLCCDVSFRVLRTSTVYDELTELSKKSDFQKNAQSLLIGLSVLTRYNNKSYRIDEILFDKSPESTFDCQGKIVSFVEYYKNQYDIEIKDRKQPLLLNRLKKKVVGKEDETVLVCLVPELCFLTGLDDRIRSNFTTMRELAKHTKVAPMQRERALRSYIDSVNNNDQAKRILNEWGLVLESRPLMMGCRTLEPEKIILQHSNSATNPQCDWGRMLANDILNPVKIQSWLLVHVERNAAQAKEFLNTMIDVSKRMGMQVALPKVVGLPNDRTDTYVNRIREEINAGLQLIVAIFPTPRDDRYSAFKTLCTAQNAIPSQAINYKTIANPTKLRSVVQKIALQINCKLGGELWAVNIPTKTLMVCGIDVYHDPTRRGQSVVGFVASVNAALTRWYSRAKFQSSGVELVSVLKMCFIESLKKYYEINHAYPNTIVLFRDGVSDGQLQNVADFEATQLLSAFKAISETYEPKFTMVVVQKRINARFFKCSGPNQMDNPSPGTVVDHTVTRRDWWDFFLVSQYVSQGTVSPTHFIVVYDGGLSPDVLQKLSYKMTHLYYNWPGTIRVPAPCQYAHKLAYQVGENIRKDVREELCNRLFFL